MQPKEEGNKKNFKCVYKLWLVTPLSIPEVYYLMNNVEEKRKGKINNNPF